MQFSILRKGLYDVLVCDIKGWSLINLKVASHPAFPVVSML